MSTKAQITTSINTITDGGLSTAEQVRDVFGDLRDNLYGDVLNEVHSGITNTQVITGETIEDNFYNLFFCKQGRKVNVTGTITGKNASIISSMALLEIINTEYFPAIDGLSIIKYIGNASNDLRPIKMHFNAANELRLGSALGVGESIYVEFNYYTEN